MTNIIHLGIMSLKSIGAIILTPTLLLAAATAMAAAKPNATFTYLEKGIIRIGVDKNRGSAIGYFPLSKDPRNLLNHHDEGRFIQQSYYGDPDGSMWGKKPWRYNPVQGGSYKGEEYLTNDLSARAMKYIESRMGKEKPFVLYYFPFAVHTAFQAPEKDVKYFTAKKQRGHLGRDNATYMPQRDEAVTPEVAARTFPFRDLH